MDRFRQQLADIQRQFGQMTPSQRMLAFSLVVIMAVTVAWSLRFAATGEQVRLLEQPLEPEQAGQIRDVLSRHGITAAVQGDAILVQATRRDEAMSLLALERALPGDLTRHFDRALGQIGSFDPHKKIDLTILAARQEALAAAMERWPGVRDARVHVNEQYKRQVGGDILPTAGITLTTLGGNVDPGKLAQSATHLVAGAFAMLDPGRIETIIDGRLIDRLHEDTTVGGGSRLLDLQARAERQWETKLLNQLGYITGLRVAVSVDVNNDTTRILTEQFDPDGKVVVPLEVREESDTEQVAGDDSWGEAGLNPNTAMSVRGGAAGGGGETRDRRVVEERNRVEISRTREERFSRGGLPTPTSCTVSLPLSWVRSQWQARSADPSAEPSAEELRAFEQATREQVAAQARTLLAGIGDEAVMVVTYADALLTSAQPLAGDVSSGSGMTTQMAGLLGDYGRPAAVVTLAAVALFFVSNIARRPAATSESLGMVDVDHLALLTTRRADLLGARGNADVADALGADELLVGREVADEQIQAGQMVDQVQSLVKENPDAAAQLVKRWVNEDR